jgi:hypothetical protein
MKKPDALKLANKKGYTIVYHEEENEVRLRKPGTAVNSLNFPYSYCLIYRVKRSWKVEEKIEPFIM